MDDRMYFIDDYHKYQFAEAYLTSIGYLSERVKPKLYNKHTYLHVFSALHKQLPGLICQVACEDCLGCRSNMPRPHNQCDTLEWCLMVDNYFQKAMLKVDEQKLGVKIQDFLDCQYFMEDLKQILLMENV